MRLSNSKGPREPGRKPKTLAELVGDYEKIIIVKALQLNGFSRKQTALSLGISPNHLWRRMRSLGINFDEIPCVISGRPKNPCRSAHENESTSGRP